MVNPELYKMKVTSVMTPNYEASRAQRVEQAKVQLSQCLAASVIKMDRFIDEGCTEHGDDAVTLELFVFTREELNAFMEGVADATAQHILGGGGRN